MTKSPPGLDGRPVVRRRGGAFAILVVALCGVFSTTAGIAAAAPGDTEAVKSTLRAYPQVETNYNRYVALTCAEDVRQATADFRREFGKDPLVAWPKQGGGPRLRITAIGDVTVSGDSATARTTSRIGKLEPVTESVPLVREGGKWKVCPSLGKSSIGPQDHREPPVTVPVDYVYDPDCLRMQPGDVCERLSGYPPRHDYCTGVPNHYPVIGISGRQADFRGPCARHDMCYDSYPNSAPDYKKSSGKRDICDPVFRQELDLNCEDEFGGTLWIVNRGWCYARAYEYYLGVGWFGGDSKDPLPPLPA